MNPTLAEVGKAVRGRRESLNLTVKEACTRAGFSPTTWNKIENGVVVSDRTYRQASQALQWTATGIASLMTGIPPVEAEAPPPPAVPRVLDVDEDALMLQVGRASWLFQKEMGVLPERRRARTLEDGVVFVELERGEMSMRVHFLPDGSVDVSSSMPYDDDFDDMPSAETLRAAQSGDPDSAPSGRTLRRGPAVGPSDPSD